MTLNELRYLVALDAAGHFGKAAENCFVSQPTLSIALKKLEEDLGVVLFERSKTQVQPTSVGKRVIEQARIVLAQANIIKEIASSGQDALGSPLRLGAIYTVGPYLLPHLLPELRQRAPHMPLFIEESYTGVLRRKLNETELDAIIIALPFTEADVVTKPLYEEPFVVLMPNDHPWTTRDNIDIDEISDQQVLMLGEGHCFRDQVIAACPALKATLARSDYPMGATTSTSLETLKHMVASGLGITVLPLSAAGLHAYSTNWLTIKPFRDPVPKRTVALAWRASFPRFAAIDAVYSAATHCKLWGRD